jgi:hypothetical protein
MIKMSKDQLKALKGGFYAPLDLDGTCTARCTGCPSVSCTATECTAKNDDYVYCGSYTLACYKASGECA